MEYNTQREPLAIREYGRNIQKLIEKAKQIEDDEQRTRFASSIVDLMAHLNPHLKNVDDFKLKLWTHLQVIANYDLSIEVPYDIPNKEELERRPPHIGYPQRRLRHRNYGKHIFKMIDRAKALEDNEKREAYALIIANYMKLIHSEVINDETVIHDLKRLSEGVLVLDAEQTKLTNTKRTPPNSKNAKRKKNSNQKNNKRRTNQNKR